MKFLTELWNRLSLKTPPFFQVLQKVAIIAGVLAGLPLLISQFQAELHIVLPAAITGMANKIALWSAAILWLASKLPVTNYTASSTIAKLPFTEQAKEAEIKNK